MTTWTIVTGGSSGLGAAFALAAAAAGERVLDVSRSGPPDPGVEHLAADLSEPSSWTDVAAHVEAGLADLESGDRVLVLHAAAALEPIGFAGEVDDDAYAATVLLDAAAPLVLGHLLLRVLAQRTDLRRQLCLMSSGAATSAYAGWSAYCASKAAVEQWVRVAGLEQAERGGVEVSAVAPGVVATQMQEQIRQVDARDQPSVERFRELHETGQLVSPEDAATRLRTLLDRGTGHGAVLDLRDLDV